MWRMHPIFWLVALFFFLVWSRRRRWSRRWAMNGPPGFHPYTPYGWGHRQSMHDWTGPSQTPAPQPLAEPDASLVESLESRIAGLEQRLEFAERLLAERGTAPRSTGL